MYDDYILQNIYIGNGQNGTNGPVFNY